MAERVHTERYRATLVRRQYIPKGQGTLRPLGIPMCPAYCLSFQDVWEYLCPEQSREPARPTHAVYTFLAPACTPGFALAHGLPQGSYALRSQGDPAGAVRCVLDVFQLPCTTPVRNRTHIHIEQLCGGLGRIASIPSLPVGTDAGRLGATGGNGIDRADPGHFRRREGPASPGVAPA